MSHLALSCARTSPLSSKNARSSLPAVFHQHTLAFPSWRITFPCAVEIPVENRDKGRVMDPILNFFVAFDIGHHMIITLRQGKLR